MPRSKLPLLPEKERFSSFAHIFLFALIISALSVSTYIGTAGLVQRDMEARLDLEASNIRRAFVDRIQGYSDTLLNLKAFISRTGIKDDNDFKSLLSEMKVFEYYSGATSIGISLIFPRVQKDKYEKLFDVKIKGLASTLDKPDERDLSSSVILIEPESVKSRKALGFDVLSDPARKRAVEQSLALNKTVITQPINLFTDQLLSNSNKQAPLSFVMYVPFETSEQVLKVAEGKPTTGVIFASFKYQDLLDEIFGPASLDEEKWNFVLTHLGESKSELLYDRFHSNLDNPAFKSSTQFSIYGQTYALEVLPLPTFYKSSDRYLPLLSAIGIFLLGSLMLLLYRSTLRQLREEKTARIRTRKTHEKLRLQTTLLSKLNRFGMTISKQFDPEVVLQKFFEFGEKEEFEYVAILREESDSNDLSIITPLGQSYSNIQLTELNGLFGAVNRIGQSDLDHNPKFLEELKLFSYSDWQILRVRFNQRSSFLVLGLKSESIEEEDIELMKSTFSQLVVALETAVLLQKAEESSRLKTAFLANMSHEIRTPLNAILGFTQILTSSHISEDKRIQLANSIEKNTDLLTRIIDDILDIAKVEAGKIDIVIAKTSLEGLLKDTKDVFELKAREKEVQFNLEIKTELPSFIRTDEYRFKQILFNLISNALKFTERGQVTVRVYCEMVENKAQLTFEIEDTGVGIPKDLQQRLFTAFYQGDLSTTRRFGGSGLGLTLSRRLALEMDGDICLLSSTPGKGSIFSFFIQCQTQMNTRFFKEISNGTIKRRVAENTAVAESKKETEKKDGPLRGRNILLVEDSEDNQIIFTHFLQQAGASTIVAADGEEALTQARQIQNLDLVLMDIQIPKIDGREVTRTLRDEGFKLPIIALTAHALESEKRRCFEAGCNAQITKPVSYSFFIETIQKELVKKENEMPAKS
ncbi:MAG: hypothetical protein CL676_03170 [Bdellovibrionaceae bacterium]|nr:hypothetical protein [Pseudobdellovibrionaceae bacterium]|tara:strand:+ start:5341 stop:8115 length:2775 start_codon:yes stop_codon:yes gene_type:complete